MQLITGGTGFVGRCLTARLVAQGEAVRVLARRPAEVSSANVVTGDVTDLPSLLSAVEGCQAVIHLVGIIREGRGQTYRSVHVQGTANVIEACRQAGVPRLLHMSALGARDRAASRYHRSKWEAEQLVRASGLAATIFRPSVMFGQGGEFVPTIKRLVEKPPVIPIIGKGTALLQPIWVEDVVSCFAGALRKDDTAGRAYELGGPETYGFEQLVDLISEAEGIEKPKLHLPVWMVRPAVAVLGRLSARFPLTSDQLTMLLEDNCCDITEMGQTFGMQPTSIRDHLREV